MMALSSLSKDGSGKGIFGNFSLWKVNDSHGSREEVHMLLVLIFF